MPKRSDIRVDLSPLLESLRQPLDLLDNPERRADVERFLVGSRHHLDHAAFSLLSQLASEMSASGSGLSARVELQTDGAHFVVEQEDESEDSRQTFFEGDQERVTIRLPRE